MKTTLLVDNEPLVRNSLRSQLAEQCELLEAASSVEAVDVCRSHPEIDLLICEAERGLVSGMELASLLRAWVPAMGTVLLSDQPPELWTDRQRGELNELPSNAVAILQKPFTPKALKTAIAEVMQEQAGVTDAGQ